MAGRVIALLTAFTAGASAFKLTFQNNCDFTVWPAVGLAPSGRPDNKFSWGKRADPGQSVSVNVDDSFLGVRAWGRTGCDASGANCKTGGCNGGLVCTDAGITSGVIVSEFGAADFGARWGGKRTSWDLSYVDLKINIDTKLVASDGQTVFCPKSGCADDQAYRYSTDYAADRNSDPGTAYTHIFCPNGSAKPAPEPEPSKPSKPKPAPSKPSNPERPIPEPTPNSSSSPKPTPAPAPKPKPEPAPAPAPAETPVTPPVNAAAPPSSSSSAAVSTPSPTSETHSSPPASGGRCSQKTARRRRSLERRQIS